MKFRKFEELNLTAWSQKRNVYFRLKTKFEITKQTLTYLKKCKIRNIFPKFINVTVGVRNSRSLKAQIEAKKRWLKLEISRHHSNLVIWERQLYEVHLLIVKECSTGPLYEKWLADDRHIREVVEHKKTIARIRQQNKFKKIKPKKPVEKCKIEPKILENFVINLSSTVLSEDELNFLNKGLKFILPPKDPPLEDICVDVMSSVRKETEEIKHMIETNAVRIVRAKMMNVTHTRKKRTNGMYKILKSLKQKKLVFTKADKSNNIIVMDNAYYERVVMKTISQGPYVEYMEILPNGDCIRDPLNKMLKEVNDILEKHKETLCVNPRYELRKWKVSNPQVPCLYVLMKTHKDVDDDGDMKARPVASNLNAPSESIAKKLSDIFNALPSPNGKSVQNGTDFAQRVNGEKVYKNEEMGSYDVTSLYPSIPIDFTMDLLFSWLILCGVILKRAVAYVQLTKVCMKQNIFQFRGIFYIQRDGTSIGCALSSFVAELFMCYFETSLASHSLFPRFYRRYIDDIFVIQNRRMFDAVKKLFEEKMDSIKKGAIKFTVERQVDGKIPFLNTMCEIVDGRITIDVYRKPTHTMRQITSDSFHDMKHKMATYHSMAHFMMSLPLSEEKIEKETRTILDIGLVNGYKESAIENIIERHKQKKQLSQMSSLYKGPDDPPKRVSIRYYPEVTRLLRPVYRKCNIELVHRNEGSMKDALGTTKDVPLDLHKSGIYRIQCSCCGRYYFGMTIRKLFVRFNEHIKSAGHKNKTAVGRHIFSSNHEVHISELKLIKSVRQLWKIEFFEAIHIHRHKHENLLNMDDGNVKSPLLDLFVLKRRVDPTIIDLTNDTEDTPNSSICDEFYDCEGE